MPLPIASMSMPSSMDCWNAATFSSSALRCSAITRCARACCSPYSDIARPPSSATSATDAAASPKIGRAHVCTPVTNAHLLCRLLLDKKLHTPHTLPSISVQPQYHLHSRQHITHP